MEEYFRLIILFVVGLFAGFINVNAGGGSTLSLPVLIFLGLDASVANGTNRIAILLQNLSAVTSFKKAEFFQFKISLKLALFTLPGAIVGAYFASKIDNDLFEIILAIIIIFIILSMLIPNKNIESIKSPNEHPSIIVKISMIGIGFYGGFIQVGVGFLLMAALHHLMRLSLIYVNMHKVFIVFIYTIPALLIFIFSGNVNWLFGLILASGNMIGAWWGVKFSVKGGEKYIKIVLIIAAGIMSARLLGLF